MQRSTESMREVSWLFRIIVPIAFVLALSLAVGDTPPLLAGLASDALFRAYPASFIALLAAAAAACASAGWQTRGHERRAWAFLALGTGMMAVADLAAVVGGGTAGPAILPGVAWPSALWLISFAAHGHALVNFMSTPWTVRSARTRHLVDLVYATLLAGMVAYATAVFPTLGGAPGRPVGMALMHFAAMVCGVGALAYAGIRRPRVRSWHVLLLIAALCVVTGATFGFSVLAVGKADPATAHLPFLLWALGYASVAAASATRLATLQNAPREYVIYSEEPGFHGGLLATVGLFLALPVFVYQIESWTGDRTGYFAYAGLLTVTCLVAVARNALVVIENSHLRRRSTTDPLTGLSNHRHFHERLQQELVRSERENIPLSVIVIDVDDFDRVNNVYGHHVGDRRLRSIAERVASSSRGFDVSCRIGGDEFAIIMPNAVALDAYRVCLRIQDQLAHDDGVCDLPVSVSIGVAAYPEHARAKDDLVRKADGALYWAKYHGRDQVVIYDPELVRAIGPDQRISLLEEESYLNMVQMLAAAVDARDPYTQRHSSNVAALAVSLCRAIGLDSSTCDLVETAALLHDIGKIGITDDVLRKPSRLTEQEWAHVREHPDLGVHILGSISRQEILPWVAGHHERWDGTGYPAGLSGEQIPLEARVLALCDAYDAMTTDRPYRQALTAEMARAEILGSAGTQFDPALAERFAILLDRGLPAPGSRSRRAAAVDAASHSPETTASRG